MLAYHSAKPVGRFLEERFPVLSPKCAPQPGESLPKLDSSEYPKSTSEDWTPSPRNPPGGSIFFIFPPFFKSLKESLRDLAHANRDFIHFLVGVSRRRPTPVISETVHISSSPQSVSYPCNAQFPASHWTPYYQLLSSIPEKHNSFWRHFFSRPAARFFALFCFDFTIW